METLTINPKNATPSAILDPQQRNWVRQAKHYLMNNPEALAAALYSSRFAPHFLALFFYQRELLRDGALEYPAAGLAERAAAKIETAIDALPSGLRLRARRLWQAGEVEDDIINRLSWLLA